MSTRRGLKPSPSRRWAVIAGLLAVLAFALQRWLCLRGPRFLESWAGPTNAFVHWTPVVPGVEVSSAAFSNPRLLKAHAVRIDLQSPDIELVVSPGGEAPDHAVRAQFPSTWLRRLDAVAAINATPFTPEAIFPGSVVKLQGLAISDGKEWSPKLNNLDALVQSTNGSWNLLQGGAGATLARIGVGGFLGTLLRGTNAGETAPQDAATCVGISADQRWMYWLVVDGGQPGYSEGATPRETAAILQGLGAWTAINLDGGSSSTLVVQSSWRGARVLNRPRHPAYSGMQRPVGNVLAVRIRSSAHPR
jgi:hypothetical protein